MWRQIGPARPDTPHSTGTCTLRGGTHRPDSGPVASPAVSSRVGADRPVAVFVLLLGALVAVAIGAYAGLHEPAGRPFATLGFSGMLQMKAWLTTAAAALLLVQLTTALWMWGRLPGVRPRAPGWASLLHRWSGATAFTFTLPVALHCMWAWPPDREPAGPAARPRCLPVLRRVRREDARPARPRAARLVPACPRRHRAHRSRPGLAHLGPVVLHPVGGTADMSAALSRRTVLRGSRRRRRRGGGFPAHPLERRARGTGTAVAANATAPSRRPPAEPSRRRRHPGRRRAGARRPARGAGSVRRRGARILCDLHPSGLHGGQRHRRGHQLSLPRQHVRRRHRRGGHRSRQPGARTVRVSVADGVVTLPGGG